jgi:serine protease inhibitor
LDAYLLELPYGSEGQLSMVVILPRKGYAVKSVIEKLKNYKLSRLFDLLKEFADTTEDEDEVEVFLPRFSTLTQFNLVEGLKIVESLKVSYKNRKIIENSISDGNPRYLRQQPSKFGENRCQ